MPRGPSPPALGSSPTLRPLRPQALRPRRRCTVGTVWTLEGDKPPRYKFGPRAGLAIRDRELSGREPSRGSGWAAAAAAPRASWRPPRLAMPGGL